MNNKTKEELIVEWKQLRGNYFNLFSEDKKKFEKYYSTHVFYKSVIQNLDKSFTEVNQVAGKEIDNFLDKEKLKI